MSLFVKDFVYGFVTETGRNWVGFTVTLKKASICMRDSGPSRTSELERRYYTYTMLCLFDPSQM